MAGTATMLITRPIRLGPAAAAIIIWPTGKIMPPPTPWMTRKITSWLMSLETPQSIEPAVKSTSEIR
jgi:hypothetical protein